MNQLKRNLCAGVTLALCGVLAQAQSTQPGAGGAGMAASGASSRSTPSSLPPGATSATGNKAATPTKGASGSMSGGAMPTNPETGSTPGMPPGAKSGRADKAMTPKDAASGGMK
jgi:hypothetical protein